MASDKTNNPIVAVDRILRERLEQFDVPVEVRNSLRKEIMSFMERPERNPYGACVMTPEASMAADLQKQGKTMTDDGETLDPRPKIS